MNSNIAYLLRTCLAKSVKEQNSEFGAFFCCCLCFTSALLSRRFQPSLLFGMKCDRNKQHFDVLCARTYSPELSVILKNIVSINLTPYSIYPRHLFWKERKQKEYGIRNDVYVWCKQSKYCNHFKMMRVVFMSSLIIAMAFSIRGGVIKKLNYQLW